ncbi:MAG: putative Ig domain-containing protein, partial [bacterium]
MTINNSTGLTNGIPQPGRIYTIEVKNEAGFDRQQFCVIRKSFVEGRLVNGVREWEKVLTPPSLLNPNPENYVANYRDSETPWLADETPINNGIVKRHYTLISGTKSYGSSSVVCNPGYFPDTPAGATPSCVQCLGDSISERKNGKAIVKCLDGVWDSVSRSRPQLICDANYSLSDDRCYLNSQVEELSYETPLIFEAGSAIRPVKPQFKGGYPSDFKVVGRELPTGILLDQRTGLIYGLPVAAVGAQSYEIEASNSYGSSSKTQITIEIKKNSPPQKLSYRDVNGPLTFFVNESISPLYPIVDGVAERFFVNPNLPDGLRLDPFSGVISGKLGDNMMERKKYSVGVQNKFGVVGTTLDILVTIRPPTSVNYSFAQTLKCGIPMNAEPAEVVGNKANAFTLQLPVGLTGLNIDPSSGVISGTPNCAQNSWQAQRFLIMVYASNEGGAASVTKELNILPAPPTNLRYNGLPQSLVKTSSSTTLSYSPALNGGPAGTYTVFPALPNGFGLNPSTGVISGVPNQGALRREYEVFAANAGGSTSFKFFFEIKETPPVGL